MTQTMDEFEKLLNEQFSYTFNVADIIQGVVVKRDKTGFLVDIGAKSEAYLPDKEITASGEKPSDDVLKIGDLKDFYVLNKEKLSLAKEDMLILHPLPRVNEIAVEVDDDPRAVYFKQAQYGVYVRMALILTLLNIEV